MAVGRGSTGGWFRITAEAPTIRPSGAIHQRREDHAQSVLVSLTCIGCGKAFVTTDVRQRRCNYKCGYDHHDARARRRRRHELQFIGVDGEGVTRPNGDHDYVLLSVGDHSLHKNGETITCEDIFPFLYECFLENPDAVYVGFALGYDFTQWFKHLPEDRARMMITDKGIAKRKRTRSGDNRVPFGVYYWIGDQEWEFDLHAGKRFRLRPRWPEKSPWMYVCDAFSFYQSSFLVAIDPAKWPKGQEVCTPEEYETIRKGKLARGGAPFDTSMIVYNVLENMIMARLMLSLNIGLVRMGVRLQRNQWYGPGQAVAAWLDLIHAPKGEEVRDATPDQARDASRKSYYGGWFEIFAHGIIPGISYEYDIHSAYPFVIGSLPCLLHGAWETGTGTFSRLDLQSALVLVHAKIDGSDERCGVMLHRTPLGRVLRPNQTQGWFWSHELDAAQRAGLIDQIEVIEWFRYIPCDCPPPLRTIADLYQERLRVGKQTPEGRALRIVLNSCYGKYAQSIGEPKYANKIYPSLITAGCRTMILDAVATHPNRTEDLLMIATDGVYFRTPHPTLPVTKNALGTWDMKEKHNLTLFLPGMYWDDATREAIASDDRPKVKSRGINAEDFAACIHELDRQFDTLRENLQSGQEARWPEMTSHLSFAMVSAKQALARGRWETCGYVDYNAVRILSSDPATKRMLSPVDAPVVNDVIHTVPYSEMTELESTPYDRHFGDAMEDYLLETDSLSPDGTNMDAIREQMHG